ncbi:hypothetical protein AA0472_0950 [Acetobacter estunensis NRIC 0472]|uniref:DUF1275 domain-containing protein n=1 Tax=Acetobacter estunensis TaxID=104097 RepID=A0A967B5X3_9PROT|nr:YoaK family protein [Acetobacter estunensis]NHO52711.1 DUF1275 domain-containing protein [Acetobacter estunensis]GBQ22985.1 hypothetical protein AA0472_0950 [Acetobacter estunensis NRIC 0472]
MTPEGRSALRVLALATTAGYVDAIGFVELHGMFTAAQTGNTTQVGVAIGNGDTATIAALGTVILLFFVGGVLASVFRRSLGAPRHAWLVEAVFLAIIQGMQWWQIGFEGSLFETVLLSVTMALQAQTHSRFSGVSMQTIVVTSNLLKFADNIGGYLWKRRNGSATFPLTAALPGLGWAGYFVGACLSMPARHATSAFFLLPIPLLIAVACIGTRDLDAE